LTGMPTSRIYDLYFRAYERKNSNMTCETGVLEALTGSEGCCRVLLAVRADGETWARRIAREHGSSLTSVQHHLEKLENGGILTSRTAGRTRLYSFDARCPLIDSILRLLDDGAGAGGSRSPSPRPVRRRIRGITRRRAM
jgi:DNA-binding transcriptional ArsR family regulator